MKRNRKNLHSQSGQMILEAILVMIALLGGIALISTQFRSQELVKTLVQGPWLHLSGVIENGIWDDPNEGRRTHPNQLGRHLTFLGDQDSGG